MQKLLLDPKKPNIFPGAPPPNPPPGDTPMDPTGGCAPRPLPASFGGASRHITRGVNIL